MMIGQSTKNANRSISCKMILFLSVKEVIPKKVEVVVEIWGKPFTLDCTLRVVTDLNASDESY